MVISKYIMASLRRAGAPFLLPMCVAADVRVECVRFNITTTTTRPTRHQNYEVLACDGKLVYVQKQANTKIAVTQQEHKITWLSFPLSDVPENRWFIVVLIYFLHGDKGTDTNGSKSKTSILR